MLFLLGKEKSNESDILKEVLRMNKIHIASLLRRGKYKEAERIAYKSKMNYFDFTEFVKKFFVGVLTENDI